MKLKLIIGFIIGVLLTIIITSAVRFALYKEPTDDHEHYHANIAMYLDGKKVDLTQNKYMEPISSCTTDTHMTPQQRVHLHNNQDTIHVHDSGVTWGAFMNNIKFNISENFIVTDDGTVYQTNPEKRVRYIVNGQYVPNPVNREIGNKDQILIYYGTESDEVLLNTLFKQIPANAEEFNTKNDPASCAGSHSHTELTFGEKLMKAIFD